MNNPPTPRTIISQNARDRITVQDFNAFFRNQNNPHAQHILIQFQNPRPVIESPEVERIRPAPGV